MVVLIYLIISVRESIKFTYRDGIEIVHVSVTALKKKRNPQLIHFIIYRILGIN